MNPYVAYYGIATDPEVGVDGIIITLYVFPFGRYALPAGRTIRYISSWLATRWRLEGRDMNGVGCHVQGYTPSCGSNIALDPVSKFAEEPSAFMILVDSCVVITTCPTIERETKIEARVLRPVDT